MSILVDWEIQEAVENGSICIDPFDPSRLGPNSYDLTLADELLTYEEVILDCKQEPRTKKITIPPEGLVLQPGSLYLGSTIETTFTPNHVPLIEGRSSFGRLGLSIHATAGVGDVGYNGTWTLEMFTIHPLLTYKGLKIAQILFHRIENKPRHFYQGKYQAAGGVIASRLWTELVP
jgi:dCTP deaminase